MLTTLTAAKTFGKFRDTFLVDLHAEITSHAAQEASGLEPKPVQGMIVHDSEVLAPEPVRQGGLVRQDAVSTPLYGRLIKLWGSQHAPVVGSYIPQTRQTSRATDTEDLSSGA